MSVLFIILNYMNEEFELFCKSIGLTKEQDTGFYRNTSYGIKYSWGCDYNYRYWVNGRDFDDFKKFKEYTIKLLKRTKINYKNDKIKELEKDFIKDLKI